MKITINGRWHETFEPRFTHERICAIAGQPVHATVTYVGPRRGDARRSGVTYAGRVVEIEDGMHIDCVVTGDA